MNLEQFTPLHDRFKTALIWISQEYAKRGFDTNKILLDARFQTDLKEFDTNVVAPMDSAFKELSKEEQDQVYVGPLEPGSQG